ncbi:LVIVD repeat-containing protein [Rhodococcus sp. NPDC058514]|uniref:LVIVD repeat-containing protein n=1 Tax=unclassified Rhodococcus (in: high G+C Gram-positive bacteria) TaxID=192944 RepID=UPI003650ED49
MLVKRTRISVLATVVLILGIALPGRLVGAQTPQEFFDVHREAVPRAECGPGSAPEPGLQGEVTVADRASGRSTAGYSCNATLVGRYQGTGGGIVSASYGNCAYMGSFWPSQGLGPTQPGVQVIDASDPANPRLSTTLTEPAMAGGTWETLKVNEERGLLAATGVGLLEAVGYFSVYDISEDCAHPRLLNTGVGSQLTLPMPITTHEGGFSPDGNTYWASGIAPGLLHAIDISDPAHPRVIWQGLTGIEEHGFGVSDDGNRLYLSHLAGVTILDVSAVQRRDPNPQVPHVSRLFWSDGQITQHSIPVSYDGHPYIFSVDEFGSGGVKALDLADERNVKVAANIKLEINLPQHMDRWSSSSQGNSAFGYESHYCTVDRPRDPTTLACGWVQSGIRVFDVRDLGDIREIAYYNPPAQTNKHFELANSPHAVASITGVPASGFLSVGRALLEENLDPLATLGPRARLFGTDLSADWCLSPPEFHGDQLWVTCSDNGFMVLQLTNDVYPIR